LLRIAYVLKGLDWVPRILTDDVKIIRVEMSQKMLAALRVQEHNQRYNIVTGDESWFYFEYVRDRLWISPPDNTPDYPNRTIATEKHILTMFWNPDAFRVVRILSTRASLNAVWFIYGNLVPLRDHFFQRARRFDHKKVRIHIDTAAPHTEQMTRNFFTHNGPRKPANPPIRPT
jgi:hypothetical protein